MRADILGQDLPTVVTEQQADCFAGAWSAHVARDESPLIKFTDAEVKAGLVAMVYVKDPLDPIAGEPVFQENGHGTAFDRVGAFQHGFIGGASACKELIDTPLELINLAFSNDDDIRNQGNLPYDEIFADGGVIQDLTRFWTATFTANKLTFQEPAVASYPHDGPYPTCDGVNDDGWKFHAVYCPATNSISYDDGFTRAMYDKYGDFSVGYVLSNAWSEGVQTQLESNLTGKARALLNDCLTGVWTKDIVPNGSNTQQFSISPGDLDEAVSTALVLDDVGQTGVLATAFEKIDNFRAGVLGGLSECNNRITGG
jgi:predicted metalloprotease